MAAPKRSPTRSVLTGAALVAAGGCVGIVAGALLDAPRVLLHRLQGPVQTVELPAESTRVSSSVKSSSSPRAAATPALRARDSPSVGSFTRRSGNHPAKRSSTSAVSSVLPLSTTTSSHSQPSGTSSASIAASAPASNAARFHVQTITVTNTSQTIPAP